MTQLSISNYAIFEPLKLSVVDEIPKSSTTGMVGWLYLCRRNNLIYVLLPDASGNGVWSQFSPGGTAGSEGIIWNEVSADTTAIVGNGYMMVNLSDPLTITLPASPASGDSVQIIQALSSQGGTVAATGAQVIVPPTNEPGDITAYTSLYIPPGVRAPMKLIYCATFNQWLQVSNSVSYAT